MAKERTYKLLYEVSYRNNPKPWHIYYGRYNVKATSLSAAKAKVRRTHSKATMLKYKKLERVSIK